MPKHSPAFRPFDFEHPQQHTLDGFDRLAAKARQEVMTARDVLMLADEMLSHGHPDTLRVTARLKENPHRDVVAEGVLLEKCFGELRRQFHVEEIDRKQIVRAYRKDGYAALLTSLQLPCQGYLGFSQTTDLSPDSPLPRPWFLTDEVYAQLDPRWLLDLRVRLQDADPAVPHVLCYGSRTAKDTRPCAAPRRAADRSPGPGGRVDPQHDPVSARPRAG